MYKGNQLVVSRIYAISILVVIFYFQIIKTFKNVTRLFSNSEPWKKSQNQLVLGLTAFVVCVLSTAADDEFHPLHQIYSWGFDNDVFNSSSNSSSAVDLYQNNDQLDNHQLFYNNNGAESDIINNLTSTPFTAPPNPNPYTNYPYAFV